MASQEHASEALPPYSRRPSNHEQVLAIAPDFPLAVDAIQLVQEWFPGTSAGDAWELVQQLAHLVRADVRSRPRSSDSERGTGNAHASERPTNGDPTSEVPEDTLMPDAT